MHKLEPKPALTPEQAHARHVLARADRLLWAAILLAAFAAFNNTFSGYMIAHWVNQVGSKTSSFLICLFDILLCATSAFLGYTLHQRFHKEPQDIPENGRRFFMANLAMLLASMSLIVVLAQTIAMVILHPSD